LTAFTNDPDGGNPAGVWIGPSLPEPEAMQRIAYVVGYSETAFLAPLERDRFVVRYYSPETEVSFCGHATIAAGVVLGGLRGEGTYDLETTVGVVPVTVSTRRGGWRASLTSVEPSHRIPESGMVETALRALGWVPLDLDRSIPPVVAYAGAWHLVLAVAERETLEALEYDFDALLALSRQANLTTLQLVWRESTRVFHARNPFPIGGVVEDPATGAAAAALGGYLRDAGVLAAPCELIIHQGAAIGRPGLLEVTIPPSGGITVSGSAVPIRREGTTGPGPVPALEVS
jgi:PhzF family phenazine biosynthesis protein